VAKSVPSIYGLRGLTCSTLFGLIAVTGLRIGEVLAVTGHVDCTKRTVGKGDQTGLPNSSRKAMVRDTLGNVAEHLCRWRYDLLGSYDSRTKYLYVRVASVQRERCTPQYEIFHLLPEIDGS